MCFCVYFKPKAAKTNFSWDNKAEVEVGGSRQIGIRKMRETNRDMWTEGEDEDRLNREMRSDLSLPSFTQFSHKGIAVFSRLLGFQLILLSFPHEIKLYLAALSELHLMGEEDKDTHTQEGYVSLSTLFFTSPCAPGVKQLEDSPTNFSL